MKSVTLPLLALLAFALTLPACSNLTYYAQSIVGQWQVLSNRDDIDELIKDPALDETLRQKLTMVLEIRSFASESLALPDNDSYRSYVDLKRPYVVWNVFAAPEFSLDLMEWCFPFAGCVRYRGYFAQQDADDYAAILAKQGHDISVSGVPAYSTLGWFDDPMMNTIINRDETGLAGLVFHELAHQQLYVKGDSAFNEGFARTVETEGVTRYLSQSGDQAAIEKFRGKQQRQQQFVALIAQTRAELQTLYDSTVDDEHKRNQKAVIIDGMRQAYEQLKQQWDGYRGYDAWFANDINNARLAAVATYQDLVPSFQRLLQQQGGDLQKFYQAAAKLGDMPKQERHAAMLKLQPLAAVTAKPRRVAQSGKNRPGVNGQTNTRS